MAVRPPSHTPFSVFFVQGSTESGDGEGAYGTEFASAGLGAALGLGATTGGPSFLDALLLQPMLRHLLGLPEVELGTWSMGRGWW
jgi:hypothetical protein